MDFLGIDIGTVSVKYVRWRGSRDKGAVVSKGDYPYKGDLEDLRRILSEMRSKEGADLRASVGITSQDILKKTYTIPILPKEELKEALAWSASKIVSVPLEEMVYENVLLGEVEERDIKKEEVFFVGAEKTFIQSILSVFEDVGFKKVVLLTDIAFAYVPVVHHVPDGSVAIIDIGGRQSSIYIFDGRKLMSAREIMTASESFTDALISGFSLSYDEAETYKTTKGFNEESMEILSLPLERLTGEMHRTFSVYAQRYPERPVRKFFIAGRGSKIPNLLPKLREYFVEEADYLSVPLEIDDEFLPSYALCAYKDTLLNLLPPEIKLREKEATYGRWARITAVGVFAVLLILSMDFWNSLNKLGYTITTHKNILSQKRQELQSIGGVADSSYYRQILVLSGEIRKKDITLTTLLKYLSSRLPAEVYLKEIDFSKYKESETLSKDVTGGPKVPLSVAEAAKTLAREAAQARAADAGQQNMQAKEGEQESRDYTVIMRGYIFGDTGIAEPFLMDTLVRLQKSGLLRDVQVISQDTKEMQGKKTMEFVIRARCATYEI